MGTPEYRAQMSAVWVDVRTGPELGGSDANTGWYQSYCSKLSSEEMEYLVSEMWDSLDRP